MQTIRGRAVGGREDAARVRKLAYTQGQAGFPFLPARGWPPAIKVAYSMGYGEGARDAREGAKARREAGEAAAR